MSWVRLPIGTVPDVIATITKSRTVIAIAPGASRRLGLSEDEPNVAVDLGDGENTGWLRIVRDEDGVTPEQIGDGVSTLTFPNAALPALRPCKNEPLTTRFAEDGSLEIRLPLAAAPTVKPGRPAPKVVAGRDAPPVEEDENKVSVIGAPALYAILVRDAWAAGVEVAFMSDGTAVVAGKVVEINDDFEIAVRRLIKPRVQVA